MYDDKIFELQREIRKLQGAIKELEEKEKKERDEEAAAKGWGRWLLSPIYGKPVETEEEREGKKRERIGRMHGLRIKEMELGRKDEELAKWEGRLGEGEREFVSGNERDGRDKGVFEERIRVKRERVQRENERVEREAREKARRERMEKERVEQEARQRAWRAQLEKVRIEREARERTVREKQDKERRERKEREKALREQQEKENRELLEKVAARRRKWEEEEATRNEELEERLERAREKMQEDAERRRSRGSHVDEWLRGTSTSFGRAGSRAQGHSEPYSGFASTTRSNCIHEGWWDKVDGRMACEKCGVSRYSYLLQCPGCQFKACASCQQVLRPPRRNMNRMRTDQARHRREAKTTRFGFSHEWDYD